MKHIIWALLIWPSLYSMDQNNNNDDDVPAFCPFVREEGASGRGSATPSEASTDEVGNLSLMTTIQLMQGELDRHRTALSSHERIILSHSEAFKKFSPTEIQATLRAAIQLSKDVEAQRGLMQFLIRRNVEKSLQVEALSKEVEELRRELRGKGQK